MHLTKKAEIQALVDGLRGRLQPYDQQQLVKMLDLKIEVTKDALVAAPLTDVPALQGEAKAYAKMRAEFLRPDPTKPQE